MFKVMLIQMMICVEMPHLVDDTDTSIDGRELAIPNMEVQRVHICCVYRGQQYQVTGNRAGTDTWLNMVKQRIYLGKRILERKIKWVEF